MYNLGFGLTALALMVGCEQEGSNYESDLSEAGVEDLRDALEETTQLLAETKEALAEAQENIAEIQADYLKSGDLGELATEEWVHSQDFAENQDVTAALDDVASQDWVLQQDYAEAQDMQKNTYAISEIKADYIQEIDISNMVSQNDIADIDAKVNLNKANIFNIGSDYVRSAQISDMASASALNSLAVIVADNTSSSTSNANHIEEINLDYLKAEDIQNMLTATELDALASKQWVNDRGFAFSSQLAPLKDDIEAIQQDYVQHEEIDNLATADAISDMASRTWVSEQVLGVQTDLDTVESEVDTIQSDYLTSSDISGNPQTGDFVTQDWINQQNYIESDDLTEFVTGSVLSNLAAQVTENSNQIGANKTDLELIMADYVDSTDISDFVTNTWLDEQNFSTQGVADLSNYLTVDTSTNSVFFSGANVFVQNGAGATDSVINGLGNLIVGYNENNDLIENGSANDKSGSHNLILGMFHNYKGYGGIVSGKLNTIEDAHAIAFGENNTSRGNFSSVLGGKHNEAFEEGSTISGGHSNIASGAYSFVAGGQYNEASGQYSVVSGGTNNVAEGNFSTAQGGSSVTVSGENGTNP